MYGVSVPVPVGLIHEKTRAPVSVKILILIGCKMKFRWRGGMGETPQKMSENG
jgi:hypothetical protein